MLTTASVTLADSATRIGGLAFFDCVSLTNLLLGQKVTTIELRAFFNCVGLTSVLIPDSVTRIEDGAFEGCSSLVSVTIGTGLSSIGQYAFLGCSSLDAISVTPLNPSFRSVDGVLFDKNLMVILAFPGGKSGRYIPPESITTIRESAFSGCARITEVLLGDNVSWIHRFAFFGCSGLVRITLGRYISEIDEYAFSNCPNLMEVYCRGDFPLVASSAFPMQVTVYHLPNRPAWAAEWLGLATALWLPRLHPAGVQPVTSSNSFGFTVSWASRKTIRIEASTNLMNPAWVPLQTNVLTGDSLTFSDPHWAGYPQRYYRVVAP